jgi:hypothetical protein
VHVVGGAAITSLAMLGPESLWALPDPVTLLTVLVGLCPPFPSAPYAIIAGNPSKEEALPAGSPALLLPLNTLLLRQKNSLPAQRTPQVPHGTYLESSKVEAGRMAHVKKAFGVMYCTFRYLFTGRCDIGHCLSNCDRCPR